MRPDRPRAVLLTTTSAHWLDVFLAPGSGRLTFRDRRYALEDPDAVAVAARWLPDGWRLHQADAVLELDPPPRAPPSGRSWQLAAVVAIACELHRLRVGAPPPEGGLAAWARAHAGPVFAASGTIDARTGAVGVVEGWSAKLEALARLDATGVVLSAPGALPAAAGWRTVALGRVPEVAALPPFEADDGWVGEAERLSAELGSGYIGVEHVRACELPQDPRPWRWIEAARALTAVPGRAPTRSPGFVALQRRGPAPSRSLAATLEESFGDEAPGLEVLFGPEGGRRWAWSPGLVVGRATGGLYADTARVDPKLGRSHLTWVAPDRVRAGNLLLHVRGEGRVRVAPGEEVVVAPGDELWLTKVTVLVVR